MKKFLRRLIAGINCLEAAYELNRCGNNAGAIRYANRGYRLLGINIVL